MSGITDLFGGGSSGAGGSSGVTDQTLNDASLGDQIMGGGGFGGTGGTDLGTLFSSMGQAFAGGGASGPQSSPTAAVDAITQATDPTGTIAAQTAITGGAGAPQSAQGQNPQGGGQGGQNNAPDQFASPSAVDELKKALQGLHQQQRQNPYGFPAPPVPGAGQNSPMLNRAGRIPTGQVPPAPAPAKPDDPNAPSQYASNMEFSNDNPPPPSGIDPADAVRAGLRTNAPDTSGQFKIPGAANENAPSEDFPAYLRNLRSGGGAAPYVDPATGQPEYVGGPGATIGPGSDAGSLGGLAGLARMLGLGPAATGAAIAMKPTPAETGELPQQTLGRSPSGPAPETPPALGGGSGNEEEAPTGTPVTKAPATGKPIKTIDPKTGKPVDPKTGDPLPTKKGPQPGDEGRIMRDVSGVSHGVPPALGEIARMAMPLLMMAMQSGFGGGGGGRGRHGFRGGRGFERPNMRAGMRFGGGGFHHGGQGGWPYHHPQFGWASHGSHPGGGWRPMDPVHFRQMRAEMGGQQGGIDPAVEQILAGLGGGQQGQGGQSGFGKPRGGGLQGSQPWTAPEGGSAGTPVTGNQPTASADDVLATIRQREGGGQNVAPYFDQKTRQYHDASGYYQFKPGTWQQMAQESGDTEASQFREAYRAPQAVQDRIARYALRKYGANASITWAASGPALGRPYPNVDPNSWQIAEAGGKPKPGTTPTGGSKDANPQGNHANVDTTPSVTQMGPETVAAQ